MILNTFKKCVRRHAVIGRRFNMKQSDNRVCNYQQSQVLFQRGYHLVAPKWLKSNNNLSCSIVLRTSNVNDSRLFSSESVNNDETLESKMENILREELGANHVVIEDISGGCGSMYKMVVVSEEFEGINKVKQHRLVQRALANEIADMHGLILDTKPASQFTATE
eukprot:g6241.t1